MSIFRKDIDNIVTKKGLHICFIIKCGPQKFNFHNQQN